MKGFSETQHVGLGGRVDGEVLDALVGQETRDQQDPAASSCPHFSRKNVCDRSQAYDIQLQHRPCRVQRAIHERALQSVAGVVDQNVDRYASLPEPLMQLDDCIHV